MLRFQAGDDHAFDELYQRVRGPVWRYALRMLGEREAAQEAAQEILVKVHRARQRYRPTARFRTWLFRIATHHCLNERRRAWRRHELSDDGTLLGLAVSDEPAPELVAQGAQLARAMTRALQQLPDRQRAAVVLARQQGCSMAELAQVLDISEGAAKLLLHRARAKLTLLLEPWLKEPT